MNAMPRNSKTLESKQLGLFEQIQPEIVLIPVQQQQLTMLVEALLSEIASALATGEVGMRNAPEEHHHTLPISATFHVR